MGKLGEPGTIEPHTDNESQALQSSTHMLCCLQTKPIYSQVTVVVLLSKPTEFEGGLNHFEPGWKGGDAWLQFQPDCCKRWPQCQWWLSVLFARQTGHRVCAEGVLRANSFLRAAEDSRCVRLGPGPWVVLVNAGHAHSFPECLPS